MASHHFTLRRLVIAGAALMLGCALGGGIAFAAGRRRLAPRGSPEVERGDPALVDLAGGAATIPGYCRGVLGG